MKALTIKQIQKMHGEPVFCIDNEGNKKWALVHVDEDKCIDVDYGDWEFYEYGWDCPSGWLAYAKKPTSKEGK